MKIIISHDVDHITAWEHRKDLIIPKFIVRSIIEFGTRNISSAEVFSRMNSLFTNKWQNLNELMDFNAANEIPATFFVAVSNGIGLSYDKVKAQYWIEQIANAGFEVGIHGIKYSSYPEMLDEFELFSSFVNHDHVGIRMHYLRSNEHTFKNMSRLGYRYDASKFEVCDPYPLHGMWEFPVQIMDSYLMSNNNKWQDQKLTAFQDKTKRALDEALNAKMNFFSILLHDFYFSDAFKTCKNWYLWLIDYLKINNFNFTNYNQAITELVSEYEQSS
ncbi:MAG: hypothetical protein GF353_05640 [Candidatus Lokiarchaeota archaeon]|nr:hypothetical protein [Candidatus Lokiarchaeota archaeon]